MARGGVRVGAGRKTGTSDKNLRKISADRVLNATGTGPDKMPLAFMLALMNDTSQKESTRLQAAIAAAPYVHPRLSSIEMKTENAQTLTIQSDLGKALRELAEIARLRELPTIDHEDIMTGRVYEGDVLEPATMPDREDILT